MKIKIQVYYHTDETRKFDDLEIDYTIADCEKRWMTFFNINAIGKFVDTDKQEYGKIFCNGDSFITVVSYQYLEDFIRNNCSEDGHVLTAGEKMDQALKTFVDAVENMRKLQKEYFKNRDSKILADAKTAERIVDQMIIKFKKPIELFGQ